VFVVNSAIPQVHADMQLVARGITRSSLAKVARLLYCLVGTFQTEAALWIYGLRLAWAPLEKLMIESVGVADEIGIEFLIWVGICMFSVEVFMLKLITGDKLVLR
jgi:hypothetical protein